MSDSISMHVLATIASLGSVVSHSSGCGNCSTELACGPNIYVVIEGENAELPAPEYDVSLVLDDLSMTCEAPGYACRDETNQQVDGVIFTWAQGASGGRILGEINLTPQNLQITVAKDGADVAEVTKEVEYVDGNPNGDDCSPICHSGGTTTVQVPLYE